MQVSILVVIVYAVYAESFRLRSEPVIPPDRDVQENSCPQGGIACEEERLLAAAGGRGKGRLVRPWTPAFAACPAFVSYITGCREFLPPWPEQLPEHEDAREG